MSSLVSDRCEKVSSEVGRMSNPPTVFIRRNVVYDKSSQRPALHDVVSEMNENAISSCV